MECQGRRDPVASQPNPSCVLAQGSTQGGFSRSRDARRIPPTHQRPSRPPFTPYSDSLGTVLRIRRPFYVIVDCAECLYGILCPVEVNRSALCGLDSRLSPPPCPPGLGLRAYASRVFTLSLNDATIACTNATSADASCRPRSRCRPPPLPPPPRPPPCSPACSA